MSAPEPKSPSVGGQAVIEGVMMRAPTCFAVAVRDSRSRIVVRDRPWRSLAERLRFLRWPFLRGAVVLGESLANGMNALAYSAKIAAEGEEGGSPSAPEPDGALRGAAAGESQPRAEARGSAGVPESERKTKDEPRKPSAPASQAPSFGLLFVPTLVFALLVFKGVPHLTALALDAWMGGQGVSGWVFHVIDGAVKLLLFVGYLLLISRMKEIQRVFAYHGAEHKAIAAHEAREPLTVAAARVHSRFHPRCGTAFLLFVIVVGVLLYMTILPLLPPLVSAAWLNQVLLILLKIVLLFPIAGLSYEAIRLSGRFGTNPLVRVLIAPGLLLQRLVTREPTDDQLEVALASIAVALSREKATAEARARDRGAALPERERVFSSYAAFLEELPGWDFGAAGVDAASRQAVSGS
ncbi:MAG: DUF1385 domain-containing protein [Deltaproteobacteria bacterium]|nr:DUF1385 domain-containing protein [Deltaproteobacteria bacterium]